MTALPVDLVPTLSLIVAALAVFFGPLVTYLIARQKNITSIQVSNKQIIAPIRQEWINNLRELIADIAGKCAHYWAAGFEERNDDEYRYITEHIHKLELYINPNEEDHSDLLAKVKQMESALSAGSGPKNNHRFWASHREVMSTAQVILKREWERVKNEI